MWTCVAGPVIILSWGCRYLRAALQARIFARGLKSVGAAAVPGQGDKHARMPGQEDSLFQRPRVGAHTYRSKREGKKRSLAGVMKTRSSFGVPGRVLGHGGILLSSCYSEERGEEVGAVVQSTAL